MADRRLPAPVSLFGPFQRLALQVHELTVKGLNSEALRLADEFERIASTLGDERTVGIITQGRMYALIQLSRFQEALFAGESLLRLVQTIGARTSEAKVLADTAEVLIKLGRLDEGLHRLARATALLEHSSRSNERYMSAMSSVSEAARAAELYELADSSAEYAVQAFEPDSAQRAAAELQQAELLLEWGLRLEHVGLVEEANLRYSRSVDLVHYWVPTYQDAPLALALRTLGLAKIGRFDEAFAIAAPMVVPLRAAGHEHEARLVHLALGVILRGKGDLRAARREFIAAEELTTSHAQRLIFQYELAMLAAMENPGESSSAMLTALRGQARYLWRLRLERRAMLQQARRRLELEAARAHADQAAAEDALTGLGNRRQFDLQIEALDDGFAGAVVLLLVDVDRFKGINDQYSHGVGDRVLREIATVLRAHCREEDVAIRFGGDEFALFLRTDLPTAARIGERIRRVIASRDWSELGFGLRVTLSIGVAALIDGMSGQDLFDVADRQLYVAKRNGRDQLAA